MPLAIEEIKKIAHLARLNLTPDEINLYHTQLSNMLQLITEMNQQDTTGILPLAHPINLTQRLREDKVTEIDSHQKFQKIAPEVEAGLYLVPQVID